MKKLILFLFVFLASAASQADDCFWKNMVSGFTNDNKQDELTVNVAGSKYNVEVATCFELPHAINIAFDSFTERVCRGDRVLILDNFHGNIIQRCTILKIEKQAKQ